MALTDLLNKARRRVVTQLLLDKGSLAVAIGMAGVIALLLAGTDVLDWYWPVLLLVGAMAFGIYQLRRNVPSLYQLAQRVDEKLGLADTLSTAVHFLAYPTKGSESIVELQRRDAEHTASQVNIEQAVPYTRSRYLAPAAGLLLVALGLFAVRYAVIGSLDLRTSLIQMAVESFFYTPAERAAAEKLRTDFRPQAIKPSDPNAPKSDVEIPVPEQAKDGSDLTKNGDDSKASEATDKNGDPSAKNKEGDKGNSDKDGDPSDKQGDKQGDQKGNDKQADSKDGQQNSSQDKQQKSSLLDKMTDALKNLMNEMTSDQAKQDAKSGDKGNKQQSQNKGGSKGGEKGDQSKSDKGDSSSKGSSSDSEQQTSQQPGQKASDQAASGAGTNEGEKALKEAEALEAMGKVSELLGERSDQITGDMMIEVGTTKQQLKTASTQQQGAHAEAGSEIHRDQVPLAHQQFVEQYFKEIRKGEAAAKPHKKSAPSKAGETAPAQASPTTQIPGLGK